jgi:hypothetical protein
VFTDVLADDGIAISMDGKGAWRDNVFVERLWRTVKYEEVYLKAYDSVSEARTSIGRYFDFYNCRRPHSSLDGATPDRLLHPAAHPHGSLTPAGAPLIDAETLLRQPGPPQPAAPAARSIIRAKPAVVNGDPRSLTKTNGHCNRVGRRHQFVQQLMALSGQLSTDGGDAGEIARGTIEARFRARLDDDPTARNKHWRRRRC